MKKLLTVLLVCGLSFGVFAGKKKAKWSKVVSISETEIVISTGKKDDAVEATYTLGKDVVVTKGEETITLKDLKAKKNVNLTLAEDGKTVTAIDMRTKGKKKKKE